MKERTKEFALGVVRLYASLPKSVIAQTLGKQVLRAGTSVGAHYREAVRSRSDAEYIGKHGTLPYFSGGSDGLRHRRPGGE